MRALPLLLGRLVLPLSLGASAANGACEPEPVHAYALSVAAGAHVLGAAHGGSLVLVTDTNVEDCDGDGSAYDFDGDFDLGSGGAAFGWGPWARDPRCAFSFNVHGPNVVAADAVLARVRFVVAEDDQDGPTIQTDPATGETSCATDGIVSDDAGDCISPVYTDVGRTCGTGGGDGLFWVFLVPGVDAWGLRADGPTAGRIVAYPDP